MGNGLSCGRRRGRLRGNGVGYRPPEAHVGNGRTSALEALGPPVVTISNFTSGPRPNPPVVDQALQLARGNPGVRVTATETNSGAPRLDFRAHSDAGRGPRPRGQDPLNLQW